MNTDESFLSRLKAGTKHSKEVKFPGTEEPVVIHILSLDKIETADLGARARLLGEFKVVFDTGSAEMYERERDIQLMYLACRTPEGHVLAPTVDEFREITDAQLEGLSREYHALADEVSPLPDGITGDKFEALVEEVKKRPMEILSNISSTVLLRRLCNALASQLASSQQDSGLTS